MKIKKLASVPVALLATTVLLSVLAGILWEPAAQATPGCDARDLHGTYSFVLHGVNPLGQPFGAVGTFTSDGAGHLAGFRASADNGLYGTANFTCTYAMSPSCTFRGPCVDDGDTTADVQFDGALADKGNEVELLVTRIPNLAGGGVVTGVAHRQ